MFRSRRRFILFPRVPAVVLSCVALLALGLGISAPIRTAHAQGGKEQRKAEAAPIVTVKEIFTLKGHTSWITSVAFSPDGNRIVTGSEDWTAKVWDARTGQEVVTLKGHTQDVTSVAFSADGKHIVTGSFDDTANVWLLAEESGSPDGNSSGRDDRRP